MSVLKIIKTKLFPKLNESMEEFVLPEFPTGDRIPKIIHQTYRSSTLPKELEENRKRFLALNPSWEYRFYDDRAVIDFITKNFSSEILDYYNKINPAYGAAKADLFRYLVVYKCGGLYLDIKSSITAPLDSFLLENDTYIIAQWKNKKNEEFEGWGLHYDLREIEGGEFQQWHVIAAPGHPFLRAVIQRVLTNISLYLPSLHGVGKNGVLRVTGPTAYTLAIAPLLASCSHRIITDEMQFPVKYSIYDYDSHINVLKAHYSNANTPVVKIGGARQVYSKLVEGLNKIDNALRNK